MIFFPDYAHFIFEPGIQRTETETAVSGCVDNLVVADGIPQSLVYQKRGIIKKVIGGL